jgi:hypothetical protein
VLTTPFADVLARHLTYYAPDQPMPYGVIDHPIQNISNEELARRAEQLVAVIEDHLPRP